MQPQLERRRHRHRRSTRAHSKQRRSEQAGSSLPNQRPAARSPAPLLPLSARTRKPAGQRASSAAGARSSCLASRRPAQGCTAASSAQTNFMAIAAFSLTGAPAPPAVPTPASVRAASVPVSRNCESVGQDDEEEEEWVQGWVREGGGRWQGSAGAVQGSRWRWRRRRRRRRQPSTSELARLEGRPLPCPAPTSVILARELLPTPLTALSWAAACMRGRRKAAGDALAVDGWRRRDAPPVHRLKRAPQQHEQQQQEAGAPAPTNQSHHHSTSSKQQASQPRSR